MNQKIKREWPMLELECIHCKEVKMIPQRTKHKNSICRECASKASREYALKKAIENGKRVGQAGRYPYPLGEWEYINQKFHTLQNGLKKCNSREEVIQQIRKNLEIAMENKELMNWINAHDNAERQEEAEKKREFKKSQKKNIDTRYMTWEEFEQKGFGQDWDD